VKIFQDVTVAISRAWITNKQVGDFTELCFAAFFCVTLSALPAIGVCAAASRHSHLSQAELTAHGLCMGVLAWVVVFAVMLAFFIIDGSVGATERLTAEYVDGCWMVAGKHGETLYIDKHRNVVRRTKKA
jgi:hypothetical protein